MSQETAPKRIRDIMSRNPISIEPDTTLEAACTKMQEMGATFIPVCKNDKLLGVITANDIVINGIAKGLSASSHVADIMSKNVIHCFEDETLEEVGSRMETEYMRRIVVLNRDHRLVGTLSINDIATKAGIKPLMAELLKQINKKFGELSTAN